MHRYQCSLFDFVGFDEAVFHCRNLWVCPSSRSRPYRGCFHGRRNIPPPGTSEQPWQSSCVGLDADWLNSERTTDANFTPSQCPRSSFLFTFVHFSLFGQTQSRRRMFQWMEVLLVLVSLPESLSDWQWVTQSGGKRMERINNTNRETHTKNYKTLALIQL